ncbi:hypothetical protein NDU88_004489 [Pleurodeles waltl]|uniref:Secreted protein n=1 Tax=Pleurodeles waltl TaxID=8319 RepID=A0AAV7VH84_PLEWA|nr:hypothetical protein NDU88_004489 [Pleurodeles waltl]
MFLPLLLAMAVRGAMYMLNSVGVSEDRWGTVDSCGSGSVGRESDPLRPPREEGVDPFQGSSADSYVVEYGAHSAVEDRVKCC